MDKMISYCGLICTECPAFLATQKDDDNERRKVSEKWSQQYKTDLKPEDINCDGCLSKSKRIIGHCKVCEIRKCGREKEFDNCAYCDEYPCSKLGNILNAVPAAKLVLDQIRKEFSASKQS